MTRMIAIAFAAFYFVAPANAASMVDAALKLQAADKWYNSLDYRHRYWVLQAIQREKAKKRARGEN